jgi:hypothetical protein
VSSPSSCKKVLAESGLSANQPNDNFRSSSHPSGQTATESFSPSQNKSFLRRVLNKGSGNHDDPIATDGFGEGSNPKASSPSVFGKIRPIVPPSDLWNPDEAIKAAIRKSIAASVKADWIEDELESGRQKTNITSLTDELTGYRQVRDNAHEELKSLLDLDEALPTKERWLNSVGEISGNRKHDVRHGKTWDESVGRKA